MDGPYSILKENVDAENLANSISKHVVRSESVNSVIITKMTCHKSTIKTGVQTHINKHQSRTIKLETDYTTHSTCNTPFKVTYPGGLSLHTASCSSVTVK